MIYQSFTCFIIFTSLIPGRPTLTSSTWAPACSCLIASTINSSYRSSFRASFNFFFPVGFSLSPLGPIELTPIINDILKTATVPVMIQPNAGLPCLVEGKTCYNMDKETFVNESLNLKH